MPLFVLLNSELLWIPCALAENGSVPVIEQADGIGKAIAPDGPALFIPPQASDDDPKTFLPLSVVKESIKQSLPEVQFDSEDMAPVLDQKVGPQQKPLINTMHMLKFDTPVGMLRGFINGSVAFYILTQYQGFNADHAQVLAIFTGSFSMFLQVMTLPFGAYASSPYWFKIAPPKPGFTNPTKIYVLESMLFYMYYFSYKIQLAAMNIDPSAFSNLHNTAHTMFYSLFFSTVFALASEVPWIALNYEMYKQGILRNIKSKPLQDIFLTLRGISISVVLTGIQVLDATNKDNWFIKLGLLTMGATGIAARHYYTRYWLPSRARGLSCDAAFHTP